MICLADLLMPGLRDLRVWSHFITVVGFYQEHDGRYRDLMDFTGRSSFCGLAVGLLALLKLAAICSITSLCVTVRETIFTIFLSIEETGV